MGDVEIVNYKVGNVQAGALASSNPREGIKLAKENTSVDEYMDYIFGRGIYGNSATFTKDKLTDIQLNMLETYMIGKYSDEWQEHFDDNSEWSFSKTEADNYFQELYNFKPSSYRDVMCGNDDGALLYFKGDKFVWNDDHPGHGAYSVNYIDYYVSDSSVDGNTYTLTISFLYGHEEMGYYINGVSIDDKVDYESEDDYDKILALYKSYFNKNKDEYKNKGYKFTFEKKNGNYYLKSFSK